LVGSYPSGASPYGVQDMAGNVWEMTSSLYMPHLRMTHHGPEPMEFTEGSVARGGSWRGGSGGNDAWIASAALRVFNLLDRPNDCYGFRVILVAPRS